MARRKRLQIIEERTAQDRVEHSHSLAGWIAREDARLDEARCQQSPFDRLIKLRDRYLKQKHNEVRVEPYNRSEACVAKAEKRTLRNLCDVDFMRDGIEMPFLRAALGEARRSEGVDTRRARYPSEIDAARAFFNRPRRRDANASSLGPTITRIAMGASIQPSSRTDYAPEFEASEVFEAIGRVWAKTDARDPGCMQLFVWWYFEAHPVTQKIERDDDGGETVHEAESWGSATAIAYAVAQKGEKPPPWTKLRAPAISAALLVAERAGLEPDDHNAHVVTGRVKRARRAFREALWDIELSSEPRRVLVP